MDKATFKERFFSYHTRLYRIAFALTENSQDAEDMLQDLYCRLWNMKGELEDIRNPEAYCITLLKNLALDRVRSARFRSGNGIAETAVPDNTLSPEVELIRKEKVHIIRYLIDRLPDNQRLIVRLRGIQGLSSEETERITGLSAIHVRVLLSRARKTLREQFQMELCDE